MALLLLSACGSSKGPEDKPKTEPTPTTAGASPTSCTTADLRFALSAGEGTAGSAYYELEMANVGRRPCRTGGFGGVSLVARSGRAPIGARAQRSQPDQAKAFLLQPGDRAHATLRETDARNYDATECRPRRAAGLQVSPPDARQSQFVAHDTTACAATQVHLLELTPFVAGG